MEPTTLYDRIKQQAIAVDAAECAFNNARTQKEIDATIMIYNAECQKLNALWMLAKVEEVAV